MNYELFSQILKKNIQKYVKENIGSDRAPYFYNETPQYHDDNTLVYSIKNCDAYIQLRINKQLPTKYDRTVLYEAIEKITYLISRMLYDRFFYGYEIVIKNPYFITVYNYAHTAILNIKLDGRIYKLNDDANFLNTYLTEIKSFFDVSARCTAARHLLREYLYEDTDYMYYIAPMASNFCCITFNRKNTILDNKISIRNIIEIVIPEIIKNASIEMAFINQDICIHINMVGRITTTKIKHNAFEINLENLRELLILLIEYTKRTSDREIITIENETDINKLKVQLF